MRRFERQEFTNHYDPDAIVSFSDLEFVKCKFLGGGFGYRHSPDFSSRTSASNIRLIDCEAQKFGVGPALLRNIYVENLRCDLVIVWGALLQHVTIKGRCDNLMIHGTPNSQVFGGELARYWDVCKAFYTDADWALDISEAEFEDFCLRTGGVPAQLIRRDPETQVVVRREEALRGRWRELGLSGLTQIFFKDLIEEESSANVLVAPKRSKKNFKPVLEDIRKLREAVIAELD
jgi:hypothetical protein